MTTWTAQAGAETLYTTQGLVDSETIFDDGETVWDLDPSGNVQRTRFDVVTSVTGWTPAASAATAWT